MFSQTKKIIKSSKREVILKVITSLFVQGLALIIPVFWSDTINEITNSNYKIGYYLIVITAFLSIFYYVWSYLDQKAWFKFYNKLYTEYTSLTTSETKNISRVNLGEYTNILNNDIDIISNFLVNLITRIFQIIEFLIIYCYFLSFNFLIFIITVAVSILMLVVYFKAGKKVQNLNIKRKATLDNKTIMLHKLYNNLAEKKTTLNSIINLFNKDNRAYLRANYNYNVIIQGIICFVLGIIELSRYTIIFYGAYLVSKDSIEIGTILLIYSYYAKILTNFQVLGTITADYQSFIVSLTRLNKITSLKEK
ncbi:TPA: ABC transporter ATP-binding protein [Candidatus Avacholeplasma faecigallinarum]|nr:ABC transporter ATP-binding protein [Candidatus Avacholeplasma faecigallinarum]